MSHSREAVTNSELYISGHSEIDLAATVSLPKLGTHEKDGSKSCVNDRLRMGRSGIADPLRSCKESGRSGQRVERVSIFMVYIYCGGGLRQTSTSCFFIPGCVRNLKRRRCVSYKRHAHQMILR